MTVKKKKLTEDEILKKHSTIDWDEVRRKYQERLAQDIANGVKNVETEAAQRPDEDLQQVKREFRKQAPKKSGGTRRPPVMQPIFDRDEIVSLYLDHGLRLNQIAEKMGCNRATVRAVLIERDVYDPNKFPSGRPRGEQCPRGHSMDDAVITAVGRACRKCKRKRDAEWQKQKRLKEQAEQQVDQHPYRF